MWHPSECIFRDDFSDLMRPVDVESLTPRSRLLVMGVSRGKRVRLLDLDILQRQSSAGPPGGFHQLILIDWDDTLSPSTWCTRERLFITGEPVRQDMDSLKQLSKRIATTLSDLMKHGHVVIVTNAETGWVEMSASALLPEVSRYCLSATFNLCTL
jgi:hypothetical protein